MKKALLIGIDYLDYGGSIKLEGCINDVNLIKNMLISDLSFDEKNIVILTDDNNDLTKKPTTMNIFNNLKNIIADSKNYNEFWFHYSGHGSYMPDSNNEEIDGKDEIIIPCDYREYGVINDDLLRYMINQIKCKTFMVYDCCHSGSINDLPHQYRYKNNKLEYVKQNDFGSENKNIFMISGCLDDEVSLSLFDIESNSYIGACTHSLIDILKKFNYNITLENLLIEMNIWMNNNLSKQRPSLSSTNKNILSTNFSDIIINNYNAVLDEKEIMIKEMKLLKKNINFLKNQITNLKNEASYIIDEKNNINSKFNKEKDKTNKLSIMNTFLKNKNYDLVSSFKNFLIQYSKK